MTTHEIEIFINSFGEPMSKREAMDFESYATSLGYEIEVTDDGDIFMRHPDDEGYPDLEYVENNSDILVNGEDNWTRINRIMGEWYDSLSFEEREEIEYDDVVEIYDEDSHLIKGYENLDEAIEAAREDGVFENEDDEVSIGVYTFRGTRYYSVDSYGDHTNCFAKDLSSAWDWFEDAWIFPLEQSYGKKLSAVVER